MLLTIPAAVALAICAVPFVTMIFQGGRFSVEDAVISGDVLAALVMGLPAYVLVKVLVPNFYARADTRTPVYAAFISLIVFVALNAAILTDFGVVGVAYASVIGAWINVGYLYFVLVKRGYYTIPLALLGRIARQLVAAAAMGIALFYARDLLTGWYAAGLFARLAALAVLVACSAIVYFGVAFAVGAIDRQRFAALTKKRNP
jgi:putative peptidoglycan lipid II flippase